MKLDLTFGVGRFLVLVAATLIAAFQNPEVKLLPQLQHVTPGDQCDLVISFHPCIPFTCVWNTSLIRVIERTTGVRPSPSFLHRVLVLWLCMPMHAVLFSTYCLQPDTSGFPGMLLKKPQNLFMCFTDGFQTPLPPFSEDKSMYRREQMCPMLNRKTLVFFTSVFLLCLLSNAASNSVHLWQLFVLQHLGSVCTWSLLVTHWQKFFCSRLL